MIMDWIDQFNAIAWVMSNLLVAYIAAVLTLFVIGYFVLFDPGVTTAGKFVFRFALSLIGVIGLIAVSLFINPAEGRQWTEFPGDILWWRPTIRFVIYAYVAYTVTGLAILIGYRKWKPTRLRTALDYELVQTRPPILKNTKKKRNNKA